MLIEKGANVHNGMTVGPFGIILRSSCMANAVDDEKVDVVRELLAAGADPNSGWCVYFGILAKGGLVQSAAASCPKIFQLLKDNGARLHTPFQVGPFGIISFQVRLVSQNPSPAANPKPTQPQPISTLTRALREFQPYPLPLSLLRTQPHRAPSIRRPRVTSLKSCRRFSRPAGTRGGRA